MASSFLHNFVMNALKSAIDSMPDFWVLNNSLGWMEKGVLTEADLAELQALIDAKNAPAPEPEEEPAEAEAV
jgi:hypothetical protein